MEFPVLWVKIDREKVTEPVLLSTGSTLIIKDSRFSLRQDIDSTSYTLQVSTHLHIHPYYKLSLKTLL